MREGYVDCAHATLPRSSGRTARESDRWRAAVSAHDLYVTEAETSPPARAKRFEARLLRGKAGGQCLRFVLPPPAVLELTGGKNPLAKARSMLLEQTRDPSGFDNIQTEADDHAARSMFSPGQPGKARTADSCFGRCVTSVSVDWLLIAILGCRTGRARVIG